MTVTLNVSSAIEAIARMQAVASDSAEIHGAVGAAVENLVTKHLTEKYVPTDDPGITFWTKVIQSIETESTAEGVLLSLNEIGVGLRYRGGDVYPGKSISSHTGKLTRALAIPTDKVPIADGRYVRPARAGALAFIRATSRGSSVGYLVEGQVKPVTRGKNKGKFRMVPRPGGKLLYTLLRVARYKGDPGILPSKEAVSAAADAAIRQLLFE